MGPKEFAKPMREATKSFNCEIYTKGPYSDFGLDRHMKSKHEFFEKKCCDKTYTTYVSFLVHVGKVHQFQCDVCEKKFVKQFDLHRHKGKHDGYQFTCSICKKGFSEAGNMKRHIRQVHTDLKPFTCDLCNQSFGDKGNLNRHVKVKHEGVRDQCPHCKHTGVKGTLSRHIRSFHEKETFSCTDCDREFRSRYGLSSHRNMKHRATPIDYICEICGERNLLSPQSRSAHKRQKHADILKNKEKSSKQYDCSNCDLKFEQRKARDQHQKQIHNQNEKYVCNQCGTEKATESRLKQHIERTCRRKAVRISVKPDIIFNDDMSQED